MSDNDTILEFMEVTLGHPDRNETELEAVAFRLGPGDCLLVEIDEEAPCPPLADAAQGLREPVEGRVLFGGEDWREMTPDTIAANRSRIGRVWDANAWVSNLDIDENITLAQRHHTRRPVSEIVEEARALGRRFGLDPLPAVRPTWAGRREWRIGQWVRALLGGPDLLLLERPTHDAPDEECAAWLEAVEEERKRGAAVVWIVSDGRVLRNQSLQPVDHVKLDRKHLNPVAKKRS